MSTPEPKVMWVIHHNTDYNKTIEKVGLPYSNSEQAINDILWADNGRVDVIVQDPQGFGEQYKLWTDPEAADWQARYDAAVGAQPT
jgi:hypothetical protein